MNSLRIQRCQRHADREAVARCPACSGYFCRECVVEHDNSILCSDCLADLASTAKTPTSLFAWVPGLLSAGLGFVVLSFLFYTLGHVLVSTPSSFHEGTVWKHSWFEENSQNSEDAP